MARYKPLDIKKNFKEPVLNAINTSIIEATFLIYQYIENYLNDWLLISYPENTKNNSILTDCIKEKTIDKLLFIHLFLENIDTNTYLDIKTVKKQRDLFAHDLINRKFTHDLRKKYESIVKIGITTCDLIYDKYMEKLKEKGNIIIDESNN